MPVRDNGYKNNIKNENDIYIHRCIFIICTVQHVIIVYGYKNPKKQILIFKIEHDCNLYLCLMLSGSGTFVASKALSNANYVFFDVFAD